MYKIEINIGKQRTIKFAKNMNELTKSLKNINPSKHLFFIPK